MIRRKTEQEIELMRESSRIVAEVHTMLRPHVVPGARTQELDAMAEDYILSQGAKPAFKGYPSGTHNVPPFPSTLCISIDDEVVHGLPGNRVLEEGMLVSIDVGAEKNGFFGDGAMTLPVGSISEEARRLLDVTKESLYKGLDKAFPGNRLHDVSAAIQEHVERNGFSVVRDLVGHGIGRRLHEDPPIPNFGRAGTGPVLMEGMTLAIEPMVNMGSYTVKILDNGWTVVTRDGSASAHFEHTVLITKDGPVTLTNHFER